jgi:hypothetical protein
MRTTKVRADALGVLIGAVVGSLALDDLAEGARVPWQAWAFMLSFVVISACAVKYSKKACGSALALLLLGEALWSYTVTTPTDRGTVRLLAEASASLCVAFIVKFGS